MIAKFLQVDALLELGCYEMTLLYKLDGSILWSIFARRECKIIEKSLKFTISGINSWYSIIAEIEFFFLFFFWDVLSYNQKQKVVTLASAQEYCRRFQRIECKVFETREACVDYPSNDRLRWPVTFPCFVIKACRRVSTRQPRAGNIAYKCANEPIRVEVNIRCGCKARGKVCYSVRAVWATISFCFAPDPVLRHLFTSCSNATLKQLSN